MVNPVPKNCARDGAQRCHGCPVRRSARGQQRAARYVRRDGRSRPPGATLHRAERSRLVAADTAEEGGKLDRHGDIWLVNADSTTGRKSATYAEGTANATGLPGYIIPIATPLSALGVNYETTAETVLGDGPTNMPLRALDPGSIGNLNYGDTVTFSSPIAGVDTSATITDMAGGADTETDDQLRARILFRIRQPDDGWR